MRKSAPSIVTFVTALKPLVLVLAAVFASTSALAQWQWVDAAGRNVFSDKAPPQSIPEKNILKRPQAQARAAAQPDQGAKSAEVATPALKSNGVDQALEAKKKRAEKEASDKHLAELEVRAKGRADNCARAKRTKATLDSGVRIQTVNDKGEREIMDDAARAKEGQRMDAIVSSDCGPVSAP